MWWVRVEQNQPQPHREQTSGGEEERRVIRRISSLQEERDVEKHEMGWTWKGSLNELSSAINCTPYLSPVGPIHLRISFIAAHFDWFPLTIFSSRKRQWSSGSRRKLNHHESESPRERKKLQARKVSEDFVSGKKKKSKRRNGRRGLSPRRILGKLFFSCFVMQLFSSKMRRGDVIVVC